MLSTVTPTQSRLQTIQRLTRRSTAMAVTLPALDMLISDNQRNTNDCHELVSDVSIDLSALMGGVE
ncbi:hypothetical protein [Glaciimonas immobilis]|uniref:Uncharacterized protein n=1 Tax=Glaciimonas immobilis TaxID=728004 RepID=A0A840RLE0_9BURK|nr:hypothetical protein [Glaciimonas immobilis]KAF3998193.1 hypothetical protein HAV38_11720 [Glaciimonas immobilis]MBB5199087.1 hypothetical protein [Glaciimonas immobilis]